jgi:NAD(P)-dependent dehydrogenase (short-subunit alcohol dehydrogenase family)
MIRTYAGAVAIVTGAASGIGRAVSQELARRGAEVVLADRQAELVQDVAAEIVAGGGRATAAALDVTQFPAVERLVAETAARTGRLDYLFNNAGIGVVGEAILYGVEDWDRVFDVNLRGVAYGTQAAYPIMCRQGYGHIVNTASLGGLLPMPLFVSYSASKHAVVGLSTSLRLEAARHGVRVSALCPGVVRTPNLEGGTYGRNLTAASSSRILEMWKGLFPMDSEPFAAAALDAVARNPAIVIVPAWARLPLSLYRLCPPLGLWLARKNFERVIARFPELLERGASLRHP